MTVTSNARPGASPSPDVLTSRDGPMGVATSLLPKRRVRRNQESYRGRALVVFSDHAKAPSIPRPVTSHARSPTLNLDMIAKANANPNPNIQTYSLPHSLTHTHTHTHTHSLAHPPTHPPTHSLTHSFTCVHARSSSLGLRLLQ